MSNMANLLLLKMGTFEEKKEAACNLKGSKFSPSDYMAWEILQINFDKATCMGESLKDMPKARMYEIVYLLQGASA